ncbi:MAG: hypothetical protein ACRCTC_02370 [Cetobacterium sp.]
MCLCMGINKIYSASTCVFIYNDLNMAIQGIESFLKNNLVGIRKCGKKYEAFISDKNKTIRIGSFLTIKEAFDARVLVMKKDCVCTKMN